MQTNDEPIDLGNLDPIEIKYRIDGKLFLLREATNAQANEFTAEKEKMFRFGDDGKLAGVAGLAAADSLLLSRCLFQVKDDPSLGGNQFVPVPRGTVQGWPERIAKPLVARLKIISGIEEKLNEQQLESRIKELQKELDALRGNDPKNGPPATTNAAP